MSFRSIRTAALLFRFRSAPPSGTKARDVDTRGILDTFLQAGESARLAVARPGFRGCDIGRGNRASRYLQYIKPIDRHWSPLTAVFAAHALASQCLFGSGSRVATLSDVFRLAQGVPCSRRELQGRDDCGRRVDFVDGCRGHPLTDEEPASRVVHRQLSHVNSRVRGAKVAKDLVLIVAAEAVT